MTKKELKEQKDAIAGFLANSDWDPYKEHIDRLIQNLAREQNYIELCKLYKSELWSDDTLLDPYFEIAHAFHVQGKLDKALQIYQDYLATNPQERAALHNVALIYEQRDEFKKAMEHIKKAHQNAPDDTETKRAYERIANKIEEEKATDRLFQEAAPLLQRENSYVIEKLKYFIGKAKAQPEYSNGFIPIQGWKFKVLIGASQEKADSLVRQWTERGYIKRTTKKEGYTIVYQISPFLEKAINEMPDHAFLKQWSDLFSRIDSDALQEVDYFGTLEKLKKIQKKYRNIILRDYNELTINYLMKNHKSVIILGGSLVELIMIYFCERKKIKVIEYPQNGQMRKVNLYETHLNELLLYFEANKGLANIDRNLADISRLYRNFIHPGKELREQEELGQTKADLSYLSVREIVKKIL